MSVSFRPANRGQSYVMVGLAGYSGTGKTYSALRLARGLSGEHPFAFIDTEAGRALHYDWFAKPWDHAELSPPFTPEAYLAAIKDAEKAGYPVIVVDSVSHEYSGPGGLQDQAEEELERMAGDDTRLRAKLGMSSWNKPKRRHRRFVEELLRVRAHLVICFRAREAVEMRPNPQTKKMEVAPVQSIPGHPGWLIDTEHKNMPLPYELTLSILLIPRPEAQRGVPIPVKLEDQHRPFVALDKPVSEETGRALAKWAKGGPPPEPPAPRVKAMTQATFDALVETKSDAGVDNEWMREKLAAVGLADVPERVTAGVIKGLSDAQGQELLGFLQAMLDEKLLAVPADPKDAEIEF